MSGSRDNPTWGHLPLSHGSQIALVSAVALNVLVESIGFADVNAATGSLSHLLVIGTRLTCALFTWRGPVAAAALALLGCAAALHGLAAPVLVVGIAAALVGPTCSRPVAGSYVAALVSIAAMAILHPHSQLYLRGGVAVGLITLGACALGMTVQRKRRGVLSLSRQLAAPREETERERQRERILITDELHDVVAHEVSPILMSARMLRLTPDEDTATRQRALETIEREAVQALTSIRHLVYYAGRPNREDAEHEAIDAPRIGTLEVFLSECADELRGHGVTTILEVDELELSPTTTLALARIAREATLNIIKHAPAAQSARFVAKVTDDDVTCEVWNELPADHRPNPLPGGGYGIARMRERIDLLG